MGGDSSQETLGSLLEARLHNYHHDQQDPSGSPGSDPQSHGSRRQNTVSLGAKSVGSQQESYLVCTNRKNQERMTKLLKVCCSNKVMIPCPVPDLIRFLDLNPLTEEVASSQEALQHHDKQMWA